jgi:fluoride exporter
MTVALFLAAASAGALARHAVQHVTGSWQALLAVNVAGSFLLGALVGADLSTPTTTVLGAGLCGALTTYSGFALEVHRLGPRLGATYAALAVTCAYAAAATGMALTA